ncbi:MAG: gluconate 2-dehydrogenase subunit 3 family protein [Deltaproteobacteria bacterium]|nr:gluconate 2-dehydrogenase subunit 3 family protein [Deltaproteobacteria bacterium]
MSEENFERPFSADELRTLTSVLDEIIPPSVERNLPGAGEAGVAAYVDAALRKAVELRPVIVQGLADLEAQARSRFGQSFAALSKTEKGALLNEQGFIFPLMLHAYIGYYQNERVVSALGLPLRPPHPQGYEMERSDLSLLDVVRRRPKMFRTLPE